MSTPTIIDESIRRKKAYARKYFNEKYPKWKDQRKYKEVKAEVLDQIIICEELVRPITEEIIKSWIDNCTTKFQVVRKAHNRKFSDKVA